MGLFPIDIPRIHLAAAEVHVSRTPTLVETVLGSCVAATFWSPRLRTGAICHGALPRYPGTCSGAVDLRHGLRYTDFAVRHLVEKFAQLGARSSELVVKLFGGADMLRVLTSRTNASVGRQNCDAALQTLTSEGLTLSGFDLGGTKGRVVYFRTDTGEVFLRRLPGAGTQEDDEAEDDLLPLRPDLRLSL